MKTNLELYRGVLGGYSWLQETSRRKWSFFVTDTQTLQHNIYIFIIITVNIFNIILTNLTQWKDPPAVPPWLPLLRGAAALVGWRSKWGISEKLEARKLFLIIKNETHFWQGVNKLLLIKSPSVILLVLIGKPCESSANTFLPPEEKESLDSTLLTCK